MPTSALQPRLAVLTALPEEYAAVKALLEGVQPVHIPGRGAGRRYEIGEIPATGGGKHCVLLSMLVDMGNNPASSRTSLLLEHFPSVECIFMVGIAGGAPHPGKVEDHVRLGDVVVSNRDGVVQYDNVKQASNALEYRHPPRPPDALFLEAVRHLSAEELNGKAPWQAGIAKASKALKLRRPSEDEDVLVSANDGGQVAFHPDDPRRKKRRPRVFQGRIGSGNVLLKDPKRRDALRDKFGIRAFEMEGSGTADAAWAGSVGFMIVRGISDYCDGNKNDRWHPYAAIVAAAYTWALIASVPVGAVGELPRPGAATAPDRQEPPAEAAPGVPQPAPTQPSQYADKALALLRVCPAGLPDTVLSRTIGCTAGDLEHALAAEIAVQEVVIDGSQWSLAAGVTPSPDVDVSDLLAVALEQTLGYVEYHRRAILSRRQIPTVVELARRCKASSPDLVSRVFQAVNSHLKRGGNKNLVWEVAKLSLEAAGCVPGIRPVEVVMGEAVALVCGLCWVLQREGDLPLARVYAERSLHLGEMLPWPRNDAFCKKCLGRIYRMEAAGTQDKELRKALFVRSADSLKEAIECFRGLDDDDKDDEIGDCYSLLGRTHLEAGDRPKARDAIWEANKLLTDTGDKDYLDLQILFGDFYAATGDSEAAESYYSLVIRQQFQGDYEKSDMRARALIKRGLVHWKQKNKLAAKQDVLEAEAMWRDLEDLRGVAEAQWAWQVIDDIVPQAIINGLRGETVLVRAAAIKTYLEQLAGSPAEVVARRSNATSQEIERLAREARRRVAREVPLRA